MLDQLLEFVQNLTWEQSLFYFVSACALIGTILLAFQGAPQAYKCYKDGNGNGLSPWFLWMWFLGEVFVFIYVLYLVDWILLINYGLNIVIVSCILRYKYFPRETS